MNDNLYLALMGELWGVFCELHEEKWPRYTESALHNDYKVERSRVGLPVSP